MIHLTKASSGGGGGVSLSDSNPQDLGTTAPGAGTKASRDDHVHGHGSLAGGGLHAEAVASTSAGFMSATDKEKIDHFLSGTGTPEGAVTGSVGDVFRRTDGATGTTLYTKETGTGNTGWASALTSNSLFGDTKLLWVAKDAVVGGDGSFGKPFKTIQAAINVIPEGTDDATMKRVWVVLIAPGSYDEDLTIDITRRKIQLLGLGPWNLGSFQSTSNWDPAPPPYGTEVRRNINVSNTKGSLLSIRCSLGIGTIIPHSAHIPPHGSYVTGARISGQINVTSTTFADIEFYLRAQIWNGIHAVGISGNLHLFLDRCRFRDNISAVGTDPVIEGSTVRIQYAEYCRFYGFVTVSRITLVRNCQFENGITVLAAGTDYKPYGYFESDIAGTYTGPAASAYFDPPTLERFRVNSGVLAGGATVTVLGVSSGTTLLRPTVATTGTPYFDTTLGKPIWRSGAGWVTADGLAA